jgi:hypothetical protein
LYVVLLRRGWSFGRAHLLAAALLGVALVVPLAYLALAGAPPSRGLVAALCGAVALGAAALRRRKLGVGVSVSAVVGYVLALAWALPPG